MNGITEYKIRLKVPTKDGFLYLTNQNSNTDQITELTKLGNWNLLLLNWFFQIRGMYSTEVFISTLI